MTFRRLFPIAGASVLALALALPSAASARTASRSALLKRLSSLASPHASKLSQLASLLRARRAPRLRGKQRVQLKRAIALLRQRQGAAATKLLIQVATSLPRARRRAHAMQLVRYATFRAFLAGKTRKYARMARAAKRYRSLDVVRSKLRAIARRARTGQKVRVSASLLRAVASKRFPARLTLMTKVQVKSAEDELERRRQAALEDVMDSAIDEAKSHYEDAKEQFKLALRILTEHMERMTQVLQKITS